MNMPVGDAMSYCTTQATTIKKTAYSPPHFERHDLRVVTLGGSSGTGDSGNTGTERLSGTSTGEDKGKNFDEDWDYDG